MFKNIKDFILGKSFDPNAKTGQFGGTGTHIDDKELESEPNGYNSNANVLQPVHPEGGKHPNIDPRTTMSDVADWHTNATQELLGNPTVNRPSKNRFESVDAQLSAQYFGNMK